MPEGNKSHERYNRICEYGLTVRPLSKFDITSAIFDSQILT